MSQVLWGCLLAGVAAWLWCRPPGVLGTRLSDMPQPQGSAGGGHLASPARVAEIADRVATALDAGLSLSVAWSHATGTDAPLQAADPAGREALLALRAALRLTDVLGVPGAGVLRAVATSIRDVIDAEAARRAATSGPVAAAWIVAGLPIAGPVVGAALGIDPVAILTGTTWGRATGLAGLVLLALGALWSRRLVLRARSSVGRMSAPPHGVCGVDSISDAALAAELLAATMAAGISPEKGLSAVADVCAGFGAVAPGTLSEALAVLGETPVGAPQLPAGLDPGVTPIAEAVAFAAMTGAPMVPLLLQAAASLRTQRRDAAVRAAGRLAAGLVLPLGLCALPGFLLLGIAPVVIRLVVSIG